MDPVIRNPKAYWGALHKLPINEQLNKDLEYFFQNQYVMNKRISDMFNKINYWRKIFDYVTNYENYHNELKKINNVVIDYINKKLILIPHFESIDHARTFNNKNYTEFKNYIENQFITIPSKEFLDYVNSSRFNVIYIMNNFVDCLTNCENNNSIKFNIDVINYKIDFVIQEKPIASELIPASIPASIITQMHPPPLIKAPSNILSHLIKPYSGPLSPVPSLISASIPKIGFINFYDESKKNLKDKLIDILSGIPDKNKLVWINNLFDNIFSYPEFINIAKNNKNLHLDMTKKKLILI